MTALLGDYVFLFGGTSCYSELRTGRGSPLADPRTGRAYGVDTEGTIAVPRAVLVAAGPLTAWGTAPEPEDTGPPCVGGTTCAVLNGQAPCAALGAAFAFPPADPAPGAVVYTLAGAVPLAPG